MRIHYPLVFFFWGIITSIFAQSDLPLPYRDTTQFSQLYGEWGAFDLFGSYRNVQDDAMAEQLFSGTGIGLANTDSKITRHQFKLYENRFAYHRLKSVSDGVTQDIWANFTYQSLWQLKSFSQLTALGVQGDVLAQVRISNNLGNSFLHWDIAGTFGVGMHLQRGKRDKISYYFNCYLPLVGYVNRPKYGILLAANQEQDHGVGVIGRLFRIAPKFGLLLPLQSGNYWGVFYRYDYFRWRDNRDLVIRTAEHQLGMSIQFRKKKK